MNRPFVSATAPAGSRQGLTLLEMVLALAILLVALAALGSWFATGTRAARQATLQAKAVRLCQSKLDEVLAGIEPLEAVDQAPLDDTDPSWVWSLELQATDFDELALVTVTVAHLNQQNRPEVSFSLRRYLRQAAQAEAEASAGADATSFLQTP